MGGIGDHEKQPYHVEETDQTPSTQELPRKKRTIVEKLGVFNILVLIFGTAAISLALAFLLFLWSQAQDARQRRPYTDLWLSIVFSDLTSKVITLSTVLIRLATGTQLGVFAALVAALILERVGASSADLPQLSIIRCANSGPHTLFRHVLHSIPVRSQRGYSIIIILAILNAAILQLTSTILLTDVGPSDVLQDYTDIVMPFAVDFERDAKNTFSGIDYWTSGPVTYPRFAEYTKNAHMTRGAHYVDTGTTYRGFLPYRSEGRRAMARNYSGPMTVVDARTVCVKPTLSDVTLYHYFSSGSTKNSVISGKIKFEGIPDVLSYNDSGSDFNCTVPYPDENYLGSSGISPDAGDYWALSLCSFSVETKGWTSHMASLQGDEWQSFLFLNMTSTNFSQSDSQPVPLFTKSSLEQYDTSDFLWAKFGNDKFTLDGSLCFFDPTTFAYKSRAWVPTFSEKYEDLTLLWNSSLHKYNVSSVIKTFGATEQKFSEKERGVFILSGDDIKIENEAEKAYDIIRMEYLGGAVFIPSELVGGSWSQCVHFTKYGNVHRSHIAIVQEIMHNTRNPALALQALFTIILQMGYYDFHVEFEHTAQSNGTVTWEVVIPKRWTGFGTVLGLIGLHFVLLLLVLVLFLTRTEMSLLGNAWQAIAQVHSTDMADVVHKGAMATDDELYGKKRKNDERVRIVKSESSGRTEATYVRRRHGAVGSNEE